MGNKFEEYDDGALFELLKNQNSESERAFSIIYDRHSQRVMAYCKRFVGNIEVAEDILQETFIRFYKAAFKKEKVMTNVPAFLVRIARNLCLSHKSNEVYHLEYEDYLVNSYTNGDNHEENDMIYLVRKALELLPNEYREPLMLREYEGFNYEDIAEITGESLNNVKVRIHRAKIKLKDIMSSGELDKVKLEKNK